MPKVIAAQFLIFTVVFIFTPPNGHHFIGLACASRSSMQREDSDTGNTDGGMAGNGGDDLPPPEPNVALTGNCLVVCDADAIAVKTAMKGTDYPTNQERVVPGTQGDGKSSPIGSSAWSKSRFSVPGLCNGWVGVERNRDRVAFSAMRNNIMGNPESPINGRQIVTFDHVRVNVGNGFDMESSTFVAPVSGVYSLSFQVYRLFNKNPLTVVLSVNDSPQLSGFANGKTGNYEAAHNNGLFHLRERDRVNVQVSLGNLDGGWKFSTFSGHLIFEDDDL